MAFCPKCGAQVDDGITFCPKCGADVGAQPVQQPVQQSAGSDAQNNKAMGILAYFGILVLIPIFAAKDSPFARFHANQGLVLFIAEIILSIISSVLNYALYGTGASVIISVLISLVSIFIAVIAIMGIVHAAKGETKPLPVIGGITILK